MAPHLIRILFVYKIEGNIRNRIFTLESFIYVWTIQKGKHHLFEQKNKKKEVIKNKIKKIGQLKLTIVT